MKVAISAQGPDQNSEVSPHIGTTTYLVVFDSDAGGITARRNRPAGARSGREAEIEAAMSVAELGVEAVITGCIGPDAFSALDAAGIVIYIGASGTVRHATQQYTAGQLPCAIAPNVEANTT